MNKQLNHKNKVYNIYVKRAKYYKILHALQTLWVDNRWRKIISDLVMKNNFNHIIDIGAGTGLTSKCLMEEGYAGLIYGIDINDIMLQESEKNLLNCFRYFRINADAMLLPFKENTFDAGITVVGLGGIYDPRIAISELYRVVKEKGKIFSIEMCTPKQAFLKNFHKKHIEKWIEKKWGFRDIQIEEILKILEITDFDLQFRNDFLIGSVYQLEIMVKK